MDKQRAVILLSQMYLPCFDDEEKESLTMAIAALQEPERKKGRWIVLSSDEDKTVCQCSVCKEIFSFYNGEFFPNYCGDCGSDMREVRKNDKREEAD